MNEFKILKIKNWRDKSMVNDDRRNEDIVSRSIVVRAKFWCLIYCINIKIENIYKFDYISLSSFWLLIKSFESKSSNFA